MASNTGCVSVGELLITRKISLVAVCCSKSSASCCLQSCSSLPNAASCWRSSAIVWACSATELFSCGRRCFAVLVLGLFLVAIYKRTDRAEMLVAGETGIKGYAPRQQASPAAELTFTSGGWWRQRGSLAGLCGRTGLC